MLRSERSGLCCPADAGVAFGRVWIRCGSWAGLEAGHCTKLDGFLTLPFKPGRFAIAARGNMAGRLPCLQRVPHGLCDCPDKQQFQPSFSATGLQLQTPCSKTGPQACHTPKPQPFFRRCSRRTWANGASWPTSLTSTTPGIDSESKPLRVTLSLAFFATVRFEFWNVNFAARPQERP